MAKIGIEVEGKYAEDNLRTYFCSAEEYLNDDYALDKIINAGVEHVYISDHLNQLDLETLAYDFEGVPLIVTVELTQLTALPPARIEIFWNATQASYAQGHTINFLRPHDQVKVENEKTVFSWVVGHAVVTLPEDFEGDVEV